MANQTVKGNIRDLAPSEKKAIAKLFQRSIDPDELVSLSLAREIYETATRLRRRVGVLISREGQIEEVFLGTKQLLYLPDLGRYRLGAGRLRALRLVFSDLSDGPEPHIPPDIYADLEQLRLDAVVSVKVTENRTKAALACLSAQEEPAKANSGTVPVHTEIIQDLSQQSYEFRAFLQDLETELASKTPAGKTTVKSGALLVGIYPKGSQIGDASMAELKELARTAGVTILGTIVQNRDPDPRTLIGKGKIEEVVLRCLRLGAEILIFDCELTPSQWRAIIHATELKVLDRSMLILDIFAQRASSSDGRLQVELAQLKYNLPRLVEKDSGLSRLSGGIGGRGPGETKLEESRRRARDRISELERRIDKLGQERRLKRARREATVFPRIAILGYTNVGKSTLFNALTRSSVLVEDKLFATLDAASRKLFIPNSATAEEPAGKTVIISDTVGFIRNLPEELKNAFRATLEELNSADIFLHVLDSSEPEISRQKMAVESILKELGYGSTPVIVVLNKIDRVPGEQTERLVKEYNALPICAKNRLGFSELFEMIRRFL